MSGMPPELHGLLERYCAVARLLPQNDMDVEDANVRATAAIVLQELGVIQKQIDSFLDFGRRGVRSHMIQGLE